MKTRANFLFCFLFLSFFFVKGHQNPLSFDIQLAKDSGVVFPQVSSDFSRWDNFENVLDNFINPEEVFLFKYNQKNISCIDKAIHLSIPLRNSNLELELMEVPEFFYDYEIVTSCGETYKANRDIKHYRGIVKDNPNSMAAFTFYEDEVMGLITTEEGNLNFAFLKQEGLHILYNDRNLKDSFNFECGLIDDLSFSYDSEVLSETLNLSPRLKNLVRFYFETEYDIYQVRGSITSVETYISGVFNQVATLYKRENIETAISQLYIWTTNTSYPYGATDIFILLDQFQNYRTSIVGDLGQLLTFRNLGAGIAAGFNGLCNSATKYKLSALAVENRYSIFPTYSWTVTAITHEFGHLLGSRHTNACVWNGNNTAIDGCIPTEGNCPNPGVPAGGGTIMSYCHFQPVGINLNLGFGPQPGNVIRNSVENASCLLYEPIVITGGAISVCIDTHNSYNMCPSSDPLVPLPMDGIPNATYSWTCSANIEIATFTQRFCIIRAKSAGPAWLRGIITTPNQVLTAQIDLLVWDSAPPVPDISLATDGLSIIAKVQNVPLGNTYRWNTSPVYSNIEGNGNMAEVIIKVGSPGLYTVFCWASNGCGERQTARYVPINVTGIREEVGVEE
ncbi:MAG: zinc-dependent metalloprotease [Tannerellaceae bacterium]|nr:zinc-dependent metalloprotease [Tannerellaceae bacterium]